MTAGFVLGAVLGVGAALVAHWQRRSRLLVFAYAALASSLTWVVGSLRSSRSAEGMAGLADTVLAGALLWGATVPAVAVITVGELQRSRGRRQP